MPQDHYPRERNLRDLLQEASMQVRVGLMLQPALSSGIQALENLCDRHFLAGKELDNTDAAPETRLFDSWDMNRGGFDFGVFGDLVGVPDDTITVTYQPVGGSPAPVAFGTQYRLEPRNAATMRKPYTGLRVVRPGPGWGIFSTSDWAGGTITGWGTIAITGLWGHWTTIPDDAWYAMLFAGALEYFDPGSVSSSLVPKPGIKSWTGAGGVKQEYDTTWFSSFRDRWMESVQKVVQVYQRLTL